MKGAVVNAQATTSTAAAASSCASGRGMRRNMKGLGLPCPPEGALRVRCPDIRVDATRPGLVLPLERRVFLVLFLAAHPLLEQREALGEHLALVAEPGDRDGE